MRHHLTSLRTALGLPILLMGLLAMISVVVTGYLYRQMALESQQLALQRLAALEAYEVLEQATDYAADLALALQHESKFRRAFLRRADDQTLIELINDQFRQYFHTTGLLKLERIQLFDSRLSLFLESSESTFLSRGVNCPHLLDSALARTGPERLKVVSQLCVAGNRPLHMVLAPVGGLRVAGYLGVITDPARPLRSLEQALGMPVRIQYPNGDTVYRSPAWPSEAFPGNTLIAHYTLKGAMGEPAIRISLASDISPLNSLLRNTRRIVLSIAGMLALSVMLIVFWTFRHTTLLPIYQLREHMREVNRNRSQLATPVKIRGIRELEDMATDFNAMAHELSGLYNQLEQIAYTDALTQLPNRVLFYDRLEQLAKLCQREESHFALLMIDLDKFKQVNDTLGHAAGDELLRQVAERIRRTLRKSDTLVRFTENTLARLGGDEFSAILPHVTRAEDAEMVAEKLVASIRRAFKIGGQPVYIGMSIGISLFPEHGEDCDALVHCADLAMYAAKRTEKGYALATPFHAEDSGTYGD